LLPLISGCTAPPVASFETDKTKVALNETVQFTDKSTGEIISWSWDFGDGNTSAQQNPSHAYAERGRYSTSLTVSNKAGSDTATLNITVLEPPTANFSASETRCKSGTSIQFTDESIGDIDSWSWDFGDGNSSTEQNPSHTYEDARIYTVSLTVSNAVSSDTREKKDYITITSFVVSRMEMCSNVTEQGDYTVQPGNTFHVGDQTMLYFEVAGFEQRKTDGQYEGWVQWLQFKVYGPDGNLIVDMYDVLEGHDTHAELVNFWWFSFNFGEAESSDPLGEYRVEVKVVDKLGGETATESITFLLE